MPLTKASVREFLTIVAVLQEPRSDLRLVLESRSSCGCASSATERLSSDRQMMIQSFRSKRARFLERRAARLATRTLFHLGLYICVIVRRCSVDKVAIDTGKQSGLTLKFTFVRHLQG